MADPIVELGPVAAPGTRTLGQLVTGGFILEGLTAFELVNLTPRQYGWSVLALTGLLSFGQNLVEKLAKRKLIGVRSEPRPRRRRRTRRKVPATN